MPLESHQIRKLRSKPKPADVRIRKASGLQLPYLEGWHVIAEANRIFGYDGWDRETLTSQCVWQTRLGSRWAAAYLSRVRVVIRAGDDRIVREGIGSGEATTDTPGQAHEMASKAAETDATKRALVTFGNAFGLSLYSGAHRNEGDESKASARQPADYDSQTTANAFVCEPGTRENCEMQEITQPGAVGASGGEPNSAEAVVVNVTHEQECARDRSNGVDKSELTFGEPKRVRDTQHLRLVARQPCLACGRHGCHAHHLRYAQPNALGRKVSDEYTVPLCPTHHRDLHQSGNEKRWWYEMGIDPLPTANELWQQSRSNGSGPR